MEFQLSYFKSWKMMLWKCCTQYASKFGKLSSDHRAGKGQFSFLSQRKLMWRKVCFILHFPCITKSAEWQNKSSLIPPNIDRCSRLYLLPLIPLIRIHLSFRICIYNNSSYIFFLQQSIHVFFDLHLQGRMGLTEF